MDMNQRINQLIAENEQLKLRLKNQDVMITAGLGVSGQIKKAAFELGYHGSMEADELDYLIETARASVMVNQKNVELQSQLVAVQDSVVHGKCANSDPCATFCEAIATRKMFKQLQVDRDALAAQVGAFAAMIIESRNADESKDFLGSDWHKRSGDLMIASPEHHLAAHDAEVAAKSVLDFANHLVDIGQIRSAYPAEEYAAQLRSKAGA